MGGSDESLKCLIFERGLRWDFLFQENLGCKEADNLKFLLIRAYVYINYEEKLLAVRTNGGSENIRSSQPSEIDTSMPNEESECEAHSKLDAHPLKLYGRKYRKNV